MRVTALRISGSALEAERARMEAISENLANVETTRGVDGKAYRRKQVVFQTIAEGGQVGGVRVSRKIESNADPIMEHRPGHPDADKDGNVAMPNINPVEEMVDMMAASRAYEANVGAITAEKSMVSKALELGR
jgi:flagellar basal-body rod protein FlgC